MRHRLSEADEATVISARVGDELDLFLQGMPSGGYRWLLEDSPGHILSQPAEDFAFDEGTVGGANKGRFTFRVQAPGRGTLRFRYARSWEAGEPPLKSFEVTIEAT